MVLSYVTCTNIVMFTFKIITLNQKIPIGIRSKILLQQVKWIY